MLAVLHALRQKGVADLPPSAELDAAAAAGYVRRLDGRVAGWSLTPAGREEHRRAIAAELDEAGAKAVVDDAYRRFLTLNAELLGLCTDWQVHEVDERTAVARLTAVHDAVLPITADLAVALDRFRDYEPRLTAAHDRVVDGDMDWLAKPAVDSYHTVWFELHEDLLLTLAIERKEGHT